MFISCGFRILNTIFAVSFIIFSPVLLGYAYHCIFWDIAYAQNDLERQSNHTSVGNPVLMDPLLKVEVVFRGLKFPSSFAFLNQGDILVLEKNDGTVQRIVNGQMLPEPILDVNVANQVERGMLGIAVAKRNHTSNYVFLYYTEAKMEDGSEPVANRLYRYELDDHKLVRPTVLLELPARPGPPHNGGKVLLGPDDNVYLTIGDVLDVHDNDLADNSSFTKAQNFKGGKDPDGRSAILRVTQNGEAVQGVLGNEHPLNKYYAYGIRNSFGMDFDPVTNTLWDTENGPGFGDEINLVEPGFNSGWERIQGIWQYEGYDNAGELVLSDHPQDLENFDGRGEYRSPEFTWFFPTVGVTALKFLNSDKLGKQYENGMFVGDFHNGQLYFFDLEVDRTRLSLEPPLKDKIANNMEELDGAILGKDFGGITDIEVGPDGFLYILSIRQGGNNCSPGLVDGACVEYNSAAEGTIYRIVPA